MDITATATQKKFVFEDLDKPQPLDSWSVIWYIASFGGLIAFFLVVSCSEWCCRRSVRNHNAFRRNANNNPQTTVTVPDTPPPSYDLFAPPSYESITYKTRGEKSEYDVYVVPVHALGSIMENTDVPPPYTAASAEFSPACLPTSQNQNFNAARTNNQELPLVHHCCSQTPYSVT